jgi:hypothetical protein
VNGQQLDRRTGPGVLHLLRVDAGIALGELDQAPGEGRRIRAAPCVPPRGELADHLQISELFFPVGGCREHRPGAERRPGVLEEVHQGAPVEPGTEPPGQRDEAGPPLALARQGLGRKGAGEHARVEPAATQGQADQRRIREAHRRSPETGSEVKGVPGIGQEAEERGDVADLGEAKMPRPRSTR